MNFIEDIRDRHKGEEIWVIGAGPSLDAYPINFFKDKVCVGVNWVFSVFINIGDGIKKFDHQIHYSVHEHREPADWIAKHRPDFLKNCFFLLPPERRTSSRPGHKMVWWEDYNEDPYYMRWGLKGRGAVSATDQDFADVAKCIMARKGQCHYVCRGTTLHWAVQAAVVLGAKRICIAGVGGGSGHMRRHGFLYSTTKPYGIKYSHWREGTRQLARVFRPYGIEIVSHCYDRGEQPL